MSTTLFSFLFQKKKKKKTVRISLIMAMEICFMIDILKCFVFDKHLMFVIRNRCLDSVLLKAYDFVHSHSKIFTQSLYYYIVQTQSSVKLDFIQYLNIFTVRCLSNREHNHFTVTFINELDPNNCCCQKFDTSDYYWRLKMIQLVIYQKRI